MKGSEASQFSFKREFASEATILVHDAKGETSRTAVKNARAAKYYFTE